MSPVLQCIESVAMQIRGQNWKRVAIAAGPVHWISTWQIANHHDNYIELISHLCQYFVLSHQPHSFNKCIFPILDFLNTYRCSSYNNFFPFLFYLILFLPIFTRFNVLSLFFLQPFIFLFLFFFFRNFFYINFLLLPRHLFLPFIHVLPITKMWDDILFLFFW